ncbi:hypothetical protein JGU66_05615 [Myxococcaceae bacterium JPH2]|nr:hypothetical protein [Myxococcaceae bacterium JPH2]
MPPSSPSEPSSNPPTTTTDERLTRLETALREGQARQDAALEAWVRQMGRLPTAKERRHWDKKWRHQAKRDARRAERNALSTPVKREPLVAGALTVVAVACVLMAVRDRDMFWLIFVALGLFLRAARHLPDPVPEPTGETTPESTRDALPAQTQEPVAAPPAPVVTKPTPVATPAAAPVATPRPAEPKAADPRLARVDATCDKLLGELRAAPEVLREVVHAPERTVQALREGCHALVRREHELRALLTTEDAERLAADRERLTTRLAAETDEVVRARLQGALNALDAQRRQREDLRVDADRLEAEYTRLSYTLENLYAQVLRVRSADASGADVAGAGLRQSVEQLGAEVQAVTEALEDVHGGPSGGRVRTR